MLNVIQENSRKLAITRCTDCGEKGHLNKKDGQCKENYRKKKTKTNPKQKGQPSISDYMQRPSTPTMGSSHSTAGSLIRRIGDHQLSLNDRSR